MPATFDGACSSFLFMYLTNAQAVQALNEMIRITRRGGQIRICEGFWLQSNPGLGLPADLKSIKGIREVAAPSGGSRGGLRIFQVTK